MSEQAETRVRPRIGKYLITGRIGKGGMGMVYRGWDEVLEREVAVKTLTLENSLEDEHRRRFQIEAKAAAKLQHPNIVTVFELAEDRGLPYIAMELLSGVDLEVLLRSGEPLLLAEKLDVMAQVCRGLHYAHERRIVHRDMKPSNIRVLEDGTAKIMDFGIAKLDASSVTKSGMMVGTVHYMSPEQIRGQPLDGRSDVFSVGVILYQVLSGQRPFAGEHPTEILYKIVHNDPPPLAADLGPSGPALEEAVARALAKQAGDRFPSAGALADELHRIGSTLVRSTPTEAQRALRLATRESERRQIEPEPTIDDYPELAATFRPAATQVQEPPAAPTTLIPSAPTVTSPAPSSAGRRPYVWAAAAVGLVAVVLLAATMAGRKPEPPAGTPPGPAAPPASGALTGTAAEASVPDRPSAPVKPAPGAKAPSARSAVRTTIKVTSDPDGASLTMDGQPVGITPTSLAVDPSAAARLVFTREGFHTREVRLEPNNIPAEVRVGLEASGPQGNVAVQSSYPVDVFWRGRPIATGEAAKSLSLPAGVQSLTVVSKENFLKTTLQVEVRGGETVPLVTPALGRLNVKANPDNCKVFIDGEFVDYPPILNRPVAGGAHTVSFRWADGVQRNESVDVTPGQPAYVTGRRD